MLGRSSQRNEAIENSKTINSSNFTQSNSLLKNKEVNENIGLVKARENPTPYRSSNESLPHPRQTSSSRSRVYGSESNLSLALGVYSKNDTTRLPKINSSMERDEKSTYFNRLKKNAIKSKVSYKLLNFYYQ